MNEIVEDFSFLHIIIIDKAIKPWQRSTADHTMLILAIGDLFIPDRSIQLPPKFTKLLCPNPNAVPSNSKIALVICLGNVTQLNATLEFLYNLSPSFHIVRGEFDDPHLLALELVTLLSKDVHVPLCLVVTHDKLRIGFTNGYQVVPKNDPLALLTLARELDVDVLIWGGTHKVEAYTLDGKFFVNPGSATGAFTLDWPERFEEEEEEIGEDHASADGAESTAKSATDVNESADAQDLPSKPLSMDLDDPIPSFCLLDTQDSTCTLFIYTYLDGEVKVDKVTYVKP